MRPKMSRAPWHAGGYDAARAAGDDGRAGVPTLEQQIRKNSVNAVLIALGIGFLEGIVNQK